MNNLIKLSVFLLGITFLGFSQIDNIQFKDMDGKSFDLYELLDEGKHVFVEMIFNA